MRGLLIFLKRQPNGDWTEVNKLVASDRAEGDDFGKFVDISRGSGDHWRNE